MSWLRNDDDMLDHAHWRRAFRLGGDGVLATWERLRSWCARRLTDGIVPADMVDEIAQLDGSKSRARALQALVDAQLLAWCDPAEDSLDLRRGDAEPSPRPRRTHDEVVIVGYLKRNPSRAKVTEERDRRAQAERLRRGTRRVTGHDSAHVPDRDLVPSQSRPNPNPVPSHDPVVTPLAPEAQGSPTVWRSLRGWTPSEELYAEAAMQGVTRQVFDARLKRLGNGPIGGNRGVFDRDDYVRDQFPSWRIWGETESAQRMGAKRLEPDDKLQRQADRVSMLRAQEAAEEARQKAAQ